MRLLIYNIHKGIGGRDRRYRIERVVDVIERENPDLLCLQEVTRGAVRCRRDDQPQMMARYFNAHAAFQQNVHYREGGYGNLVLSRWPLMAKHHISLRLNRKKPRGAQLLVVDTPEGPLHLVNYHLGLAETERQWQVTRLLEHHLFRREADRPTMIAGDSNDWRNALINSVYAPHGFQQVTSPPSRFRSFPAYMPVGSLDKAFYRGRIFVRGATVVRSMLAKEASDHLPVVIDFHLRPFDRLADPDRVPHDGKN